MGLPKLKTKISIEDYLEGEKISQVRYEYLNGEVYAMAGASDTHYRISMNIATKLDSHLENSDCEAFMAEMKLRADEKTFYYPDVFVACDKVKKSKFYREEPILIIEVISPSTRQTDRREKTPHLSTNSERSRIRHRRTRKNPHRTPPPPTRRTLDNLFLQRKRYG